MLPCRNLTYISSSLWKSNPTFKYEKYQVVRVELFKMYSKMLALNHLSGQIYREQHHTIRFSTEY